MRNLLLTALMLLASRLGAQDAAGLKFTAHVLGGAHHLNDPLSIEIRLENTGPREIYLYSDLNYGIQVFASNSDGKDLARESIIEALPPPPDRDRFSRLEPGHFLGLVWHERLGGMGIHRPGTYRLMLGYTSHFTPEFSFGLPVWNGNLSASDTFTVAP